MCVCVCLCRRSFNKPKVLPCALVLLTKTEKNKLASKWKTKTGNYWKLKYDRFRNDKTKITYVIDLLTLWVVPDSSVISIYKQQYSLMKVHRLALTDCLYSLKCNDFSILFYLSLLVMLINNIRISEIGLLWKSFESDIVLNQWLIVILM